MEMPLVSILMTAYNREQYIAEAIESVLASTYRNFELIIVDDCSEDKTTDIAQSYADRDGRVCVHRNVKNLGDYHNRNRSASFACGKYIKYLDSDDIILPWALEVMVRCMENHPSAVLGLSPNIAVNERLPLLVTPEQAYYLYYFKGFLLNVGPTGTIIRRDAFKRLGGFSGDQYIGDTELWLRMAQRYPVICLPANLIWWREHEEQQIVSERKDQSVEKKRFDLNEKILNDELCPLTREISFLVLQNIRAAQCRMLVMDLVKFRFAGFKKRTVAYNLTAKDFIRALKKNKIPVMQHPFKSIR